MPLRAMQTFLFGLGVFFSSLSCFLHAGESPRPLRIWVMPNGPAKTAPALSTEQINSFIEKTKRESGVLVENTAEDLTMPADANRAVPLLNHVLDHNIFLRQVAEFIKADNSGPAAVEYLRWSDALFRLNNSRENVDAMPDVVQIGGLYPGSSGADPEDELYSTPWFIDIRVMYYNKGMVEDPDSLSGWDSFLDLCERWKAQPKKLIAFPIASEWNLLHNLSPWIWASGGDIIDVDKRSFFSPYKVALDRQESIDGVMYLKKIADTGCADFVETSSSEVEDMFLAGKYATIITGTWFTSKLKSGWEKIYGVTTIPAGRAGSAPFMGGSRLSVWKGAGPRGNTDRARRFIEYVTDEKQQYAFALETGFLPTNTKALEMYSKSLKSPAFSKSVDRGRSYPEMPNWSDIVERGIVREHIWQLWRDIASRQPQSVILDTVKSAAQEIKKRILIAKFQKYLFAEMSLILGFMVLVIFVIYNSRRRTTGLLSANLFLAKKIREVEGRYDITMGKLAILEQKYERAANERQLIAADLNKYREKSRELVEELGHLRKQQNTLTRKKPDNFFIRWDGTLLIDGRELSFDNNRQAKRMIDFVVRATREGLSSMHCIWGYPCFEWDPERVKSAPARLFNTAVSKLNNPIKKEGLSPILISQGRGSGTWRLVWDRNIVVKNSDVGRAYTLIGEAKDFLSKGLMNDAFLTLGRAIEVDTLCTDAYILLNEFEWKKLVKDDSLKDKISRHFESAKDVIELYIKNLENGIRAAGVFVDGLPYANSDRDAVLREELIRMKGMLSRFKDIYDCCIGEQTGSVPLHLKSLLESLQLVHKATCDMRASKISRQVIWSEIAHNENFLYFTSSPKVGAVINNFYSPETRMVEDVRLVKLALIWMLENPGMLSPIFSASNEEKLVTTLKTQLRRQLSLLDNELMTMPEF